MEALLLSVMYAPTWATVAVHLLFVVFLIVMVASGVVAQRRGGLDPRVTQWAAENRLKLTYVELLWSPISRFYGPEGTTNQHVLYRISAQDERGQTVNGMLRLYSCLFGLYPDKVEFFLDAKKAAPVDDWSISGDTF